MIVLFREASGRIPFLVWFEGLNTRGKAKIRAALVLLGREGHRLRRPLSAHLGNGIHELRVRVGREQLRTLYFFHGMDFVVISHGFHKRAAAVPEVELERVRQRRRQFEGDPARFLARDPR